MKSFKRFLKEDWWDDLGPDGQKKYIADHPNSEKAKSANKSKDDRKNKPYINWSAVDKMDKHKNDLKDAKSLKNPDKLRELASTSSDSYLHNWDAVEVKSAVAGNKNTPADVLRKLANSPNDYWGMGGRHENGSIYQSLAKNPKSPIDVLEKICSNKNNKDDIVSLVNVCGNPNATKELLRKLSKHKDDWVSGVAKGYLKSRFNETID